MVMLMKLIDDVTLFVFDEVGAIWNLTVSALPVNPVPPSAHLPEEVWDNLQVHGHMHTAAFVRRIPDTDTYP